MAAVELKWFAALLRIDAQEQPGVVQWCASRSHAGGEFDVVFFCFYVGDMRVDIPQTIVACERFKLDCACVL